jgi:beta-lactam-binding protein with PASTA domain
MAMRTPTVATASAFRRAAALLLGLAVAGTVGAGAARAEDRRRVPEVVDLPVEQAVRMLATNGFVAEQRPVSGFPAGTVARQSPGGFTYAAPGATVVVEVRGAATAATPPRDPSPVPAEPPVAPPQPPAEPARVPLPEVLGLLEADAAELLREFRVAVRGQEAEAEDAGRVVAQVPVAGTPLAPGSVVTLHVGRRRAPEAGTALVPSVVGLSQDRASQLLEASDLAVVVVQGAAEPDDAGKVLSQDPAGGAVVARRSQVTLTVGREVIGPLMEGEVPPLQGLVEASARSQVERAGFVSAVTYVLAPASAGRVVSQEPAAGTRLLRGRPVALRVGVAMLLPATVPSVLEQEAAAAEAALVEAGFAVETGTAVSLAGSAGRVVSQDPPGGTSAIRGTTVRIVVGRPVAPAPPTPSAAGATVAVPALVGRTDAEARAALLDLGFRVEIEILAGPAADAGRVREQSPAPGTPAPRGSTVRLRVGRADAPAGRGNALPSYVGMTLSDAQQDLAARGLVGMTRSVPGSPEGRVVDQSPPPGTAVAAGSVVQLTVSHGAAGLAMPVLLAPPSGNATPRAYGITFQWQPVPGAEDYQFEVMVLKGDAWVVADNDVVRGTYKRPSQVKRGRYRWHVRGRRDDGKVHGPWSEWRDFSIY